jgi:hypothetical protein
MRNRPDRWVFVIIVLLTACKREVAAPMLAAPAARGFAMAAVSGDTNRRIALSHDFAVELPSAMVEATQQSNLTECLAAGCTVLNIHINRLRNGVIEAAISVRIAPDHYAAFAAAITAKPATLVSHTETATDETVPLLDIEKRLDAQLALRDRLSLMLTQAGTNVADLVAVEKQLADVQGTIESETAQRDYLRTLTDTVKVDVSYNGVVQQAGSFDISPIRIALDNFLTTLTESIGILIVCLATALPWLPLAVLAAWVLRRLLRRWV